MSVTAGKIENDAREMLNDIWPSGYRWLAPQVLRFVYDGVRRLNSIRPESRYAGLTLATLVVPTIADGIDAAAITAARAAAIVLDDRWVEGIAHYVAYRCYSLDDPDTRDTGKAKEHEAEFERIAKT